MMHWVEDPSPSPSDAPSPFPCYYKAPVELGHQGDRSLRAVAKLGIIPELEVKVFRH